MGNSRFEPIAPSAGQRAAMTDLAQGAVILERMFAELCPESRERSLALTNLEQAMMWINKGIATHGVN